MYTASAFAVNTIFRCAFGAVCPLFTTAMFEGVRLNDSLLDDYSSVSVDGRKLGVYIIGLGVSYPLPYPDCIPQIWSTDTS